MKMKAFQNKYIQKKSLIQLAELKLLNAKTSLRLYD